jgi:hypothetical protein
MRTSGLRVAPGRGSARVLKGEKPADLPVQEVIKFRIADQPEKPRRRSAFAVPQSLLARAEEVIE